jgi:hypothetical protein
MNCIAAAGATASRLEKAVTVQAGPGFDFDGAQPHQTTCLVLLFNLFDDSNRQELDFVRENVIRDESFHDYLFFELPDKSDCPGLLEEKHPGLPGIAF